MYSIDIYRISKDREEKVYITTASGIFTFNSTDRLSNKNNLRNKNITWKFVKKQRYI